MKALNEYQTVFDDMFEGIYMVTPDRKIIYWNRAAENITGFSSKETVSQYCFNNILNHVSEEGKYLCLGGCPLDKTLIDGQPRSANVYLQHKRGYRVPVAVRIFPIIENGKITGALEAFTDSADRSNMDSKMDELARLAFTDKLTGISNRQYAEIRLASKFAEFRSTGIPFGVIFFDIDHFKKFNDSYGHQTGDEILKVVAQTAMQAVRSSDVVSRWGGEEFVALLSPVVENSLASCMERLRLMIESAGIRAGHEILRVTASLGATLSLPDDTPESFIERSDALMYQSKTAGRNRSTVG